MSERINLTASNINKVLSTAPVKVETSPTQTSLSVKMTSVNGVSMTFSIPAATSTRAGLMTAAVYTQLTKISGDVSKLNANYAKLPAIPTIATAFTNENICALNFLSGDQSTFAVNIPAATGENAGVMTAGGFKKLEKAAAVFKARKVRGVTKTDATPAPFIAPAGELVLDEIDGVLCLYFGLIGLYATSWNASQNADGLTADEYNRTDVIINASGYAFTYDGSKWIGGASGGSSAAIYKWRSDNERLIISSDAISEGDTPVLYRYKRGTYGKEQSRQMGFSEGRRGHYNGWVKTPFPCSLVKISDGRWEVKPAGYDSFAAFTRANPPVKGNKSNSTNLLRKCAIVLERSGKPVTDYVKFRVAYTEGAGYRMARW